MVLIVALGSLGLFALCLLAFSWMEAMNGKYEAASCSYEPEFGSIDWIRLDASRRGLTLHLTSYLDGREIYVPQSFGCHSYEELQDEDVQAVLRATNNLVEV
tara:strand:+ start:2849 stop:3154 length:306 start_codon:yes stop_codon:yes gene_type:complete